MKEDKVYLLHIRDAIEKIEKFISKLNYQKFLRDDLIQSAVIRQIEIIGEAAKKLSTDLKKNYKEIPWKDVAGMRDKLIHEYFGVDLKRVWSTVKKDIPILKKNIKKILKEKFRIEKSFVGNAKNTLHKEMKK